MAVKTISKNGKRVPAEQKGKGQKKAKAGKAKRPIAEKSSDTPSEVPPKTSATPKSDVIDREPVTAMVRIRVPSDIGKVCSTEQSRYAIDSVAVLPDHGSNDRVFLVATDGRALAITVADYERVGNIEAAGLKAGWMPRGMAKAETDLRLAKGTAETLFGAGLKWVNDAAGHFDEVPSGGMFPPFLEVLPESNDDCTVVCINVKLLANIAAAVNDPDNKERVLMMVPPACREGHVARSVRILGTRGIGLLMPISCDAAASRSAWITTRKMVQKGRPRPKKIYDDGTPAISDPAPDAAQQFPSSTPPETVIDKETGEVREVHRDPTGTADYTLTTPIIPDADDDDDGKDAPTSPIKVAEMTLSAETKAALANVGIVTVKDVADYIEGGGDLGALVDSFSERNRLLTCAKPFLPEPADSAA